MVQKAAFKKAAENRDSNKNKGKKKMTPYKKEKGSNNKNRY